MDPRRAPDRRASWDHPGGRPGRGDVRRRPHECRERGADHQPDHRDHSPPRPLGPPRRTPAVLLRGGRRVSAGRRPAHVGQRLPRAPPRRSADARRGADPGGACGTRGTAHREPCDPPAAADHRADPRRLGAVPAARVRGTVHARPHRRRGLGPAALSRPVLQRVRVPRADLGRPAHLGEPRQPPPRHRTDLGRRGRHRPRRRPLHPGHRPRRDPVGHRNLLGPGDRTRPPSQSPVRGAENCATSHNEPAAANRPHAELTPSGTPAAASPRRPAPPPSHRPCQRPATPSSARPQARPPRSSRRSRTRTPSRPRRRADHRR